jgi:hypothetical protein
MLTLVSAGMVSGSVQYLYDLIGGDGLPARAVVPVSV